MSSRAETARRRRRARAAIRQRQKLILARQERLLSQPVTTLGPPTQLTTRSLARALDLSRASVEALAGRLLDASVAEHANIAWDRQFSVRFQSPLDYGTLSELMGEVEGDSDVTGPARHQHSMIGVETRDPDVGWLGRDDGVPLAHSNAWYIALSQATSELRRLALHYKASECHALHVWMNA